MTQKVKNEWRELFEERAAIMEYDGGLSREEAEQEAEKIIQALKNDPCDIESSAHICPQPAGLE